MRRIPPLALALAMALGACQEAPGPLAPATTRAPRAAVGAASAAARLIPDDYIVVFRPGVRDVAGLARQLTAARGGTLGFLYQHALQGFSAHLSAQAAAALRNNPNVAYVEQDQVATASGTETGATWGIDRIDQRAGLDGTYSWNENGAGVTAYIIDTGIDIAHPDFGGRARIGVDEIGDGRDGFDCDGHGTHVSGTVGGTKYGVAKGVSLVAVRVLDCSGNGSFAGVVAGVDWVTGDHRAGSPAVANMSLGGSSSSAVDQAVEASIADGVAYAVAAGNAGWDACYYSPADAPDAMTIGATGSNDQRPYWSNYGSCVDWFAPGVNITSDWPGARINTISGTSMATPHTTGVAALYLQANPSAMPKQVRDALYAATDKGIVGALNSANGDLLYTPPAGWGSTPPPTNQPPNADFGASCADLSCQFTDWSSDSDGTVTAWSWDFGDGTSSGAQSPSHTYGSANTYTVTLMVTDDDGASSTTTSHDVTVTSPGTPPPTVITLTVSDGSHGAWTTANLSWSGSSAASIDVYRDEPGGTVDFQLIATTPNDGQYSDKIGKNMRGTWTDTYKVCEAGTQVCSDPKSITF